MSQNKVITKEQFALWSFERDKKEKALDRNDTFEDLKDIYLEEAEYYLSKQSPLGYPDDIIARGERDGIVLP
jgi:hypothetical protein